MEITQGIICLAAGVAGIVIGLIGFFVSLGISSSQRKRLRRKISEEYMM